MPRLKKSTLPVPTAQKPKKVKQSNVGGKKPSGVGHVKAKKSKKPRWDVRES